MSKLANLIRNDGWKSLITGLGVIGKDKRTSSKISFRPMAQGEAEDLYSADEMAERVVDLKPLDMLREGFRLVSPDIDDEVLEQAMDYFDRLVLTDDGNKFGEAMIWGRMYGGAALVIGLGNDDDLLEPLDLDRLQTIEHLTLLNRWELTAHKINGNPADPNFGMPETYHIQPNVVDTVGSDEGLSFTTSVTEIHHSRLIRFDGARLPRNTFIRNNYWHDSILNKISADIRDFQNSFSSVHALILDFAQAVYKVKGLAAILSSPNGLETMQRRIAIIDQARSVLRAAIVDADSEDFERKTTSMQGLDSVLDKITKKFTASTGYPHTILLGESPSGLGATGNSEKQDYYEMIRREQKQSLKPRLLRTFRYIFAAADGPTQGKVPEKFDIEFEPLKHLDQKEEIEARKMQAETDRIYLETGAVDPDEIAMSRFGTGEYSFDTEINETLRNTNERDEFEPETADPEGNPVVTDEYKGKSKRRKKANRSRNFSGRKFR